MHAFIHAYQASSQSSNPAYECMCTYLGCYVHSLHARMARMVRMVVHTYVRVQDASRPVNHPASHSKLLACVYFVKTKQLCKGSKY